MFKKGFTIQELLITMAIVGIVAAITAPSIQKIIPNEQKMRYMKAYNAVTSITNDIVSDSSLYWTDYNNSGNAICHDLGCINTTQDSYIRLRNNRDADQMLRRLNVNSFATNWYNLGATGGNANYSKAKFAILFASKLNLQSNPICDTRGGWGDNAATCDFVTIDGYRWIINTNITSSSVPMTATHRILVDIYSDNAGIMTDDGLNNGTPKDIDTFIFDISNEGNVSIPDSEYLAEEFLKNPTDMHNAAKEIQAAESSYKAKLKKGS